MPGPVGEAISTVQALENNDATHSQERRMGQTLSKSAANALRRDRDEHPRACVKLTAILFGTFVLAGSPSTG